MAIEKAREYLKKYGLIDKILEFDASSATVYPACGSSNSARELTSAKLEDVSGCEGWVDVCKNWE